MISNVVAAQEMDDVEAVCDGSELLAGISLPLAKTKETPEVVEISNAEK